MKNKKYLILLVVCLIVIIGLFFLFRDKQLDVNSDKIASIYSYLGSADDNHCGGLITYTEDTITSSDISLDTKLCKAYYNIENIETGTLNVTTTSKNDNKVCKEGDITIVSDAEDNKTCSYTKVTKEELNQAYKSMYGEEISEYETFYIDDTHACYLDGEGYMCGESETFSYSISPDAVIYRVLTKAVEKNDEIILTDYFLKISNNKCYIASTGSTENTECTNKLTDAGDINSEFVIKNGTKYEHIFKKDNDNYYWYQSSKK